MRNLIGGSAGVALLAGVLVTPAAAQIYGNATYAAMPGTGVTISADYGLSLNDDAKYPAPGFATYQESASYIGGRIGLGLSKFGVWAGAGSAPMFTDSASSKIGFGGGVGFHALSGPDMPLTVSVQAGAGYYKQPEADDDFSLLAIPFGVLLTINVPTTGVGVTPWVYPRGEYVSFKLGNADSRGKVGFGVSGGLMVALPMGLGIHGTLDWATVSDLFAEGYGNFKPLVASFGLYYKISVPSLGM